MFLFSLLALDIAAEPGLIIHTPNVPYGWLILIAAAAVAVAAVAIVRAVKKRKK